MSAGTAPPRLVVVAGIGNRMRHDDGAGPAAAERAAGAGAGGGRPAVEVIGPLGEPLDLLNQWDAADLAIVVDAVRSGARAGTVTLTYLGTDDGALEEPGRAKPSTHGLGLGDVYRIALATGAAPARVALIGIEGRDFSAGEGLSPEVDAGASRAAGLVARLAGTNCPRARRLRPANS